MALHNRLGCWGERIAADRLVSAGYAILERNWHIGRYEIDLIAMKGNRIIFVEVKTRTDDTVDPVLAVDRKKILRLTRAANTYMQIHDYPHEVQFDIITIVGSPADYRIEHIEDAFLPPLKTYR